jgi:hypothetical protein
MARQKGIIKIEGTIGEYTFYKSKDGYIAKQKGGVDAARIKNDPAFARTRENGKEFATSASAGKMVRDAIRSLMLNAADNRAGSRLTKLMSVIKNLDGTSVRGDRNVGVGINTLGAKELFKGFDFNLEATLGSKLFKAYTVTPGTGEIQIKNLVPTSDLIAPPGATHVAFTGAWARIDFTTGASEYEESMKTNLLLDATPVQVSLVPSGQPAGPGTDLFLLKIEFFQEVNGAQYSLKNGAFNVLNVVEVG